MEKVGNSVILLAAGLGMLVGMGSDLLMLSATLSILSISMLSLSTALVALGAISAITLPSLIIGLGALKLLTPKQIEPRATQVITEQAEPSAQLTTESIKTSVSQAVIESINKLNSQTILKQVETSVPQVAINSENQIREIQSIDDKKMSSTKEEPIIVTNKEDTELLRNLNKNIETLIGVVSKQKNIIMDGKKLSRALSMGIALPGQA